MTSATMTRYRRLAELSDSLPPNNRIRQECAAALNQIDEQAREIERLRAGLEIFAEINSWNNEANRAWTKPGFPHVFARSVLEDKP